MGKLKFPYTMHCPACKAGLKISNPKQVGTMINCPKCKKKIEVVTPDEDAHVSYGVEETEEEDEPKKKKPSKKEVEAKRLEAEKEKRAKIMGNVSHVASIIGTLAALVACIGVFYYFIVLKPAAETDEKKKKKAAIERIEDFGTLAWSSFADCRSPQPVDGYLFGFESRADASLMSAAERTASPACWNA